MKDEIKALLSFSSFILHPSSFILVPVGYGLGPMEPNLNL
jgi:hypothetical protein